MTAMGEELAKDWQKNFEEGITQTFHQTMMRNTKESDHVNQNHITIIRYQSHGKSRPH
jgi:hypothetical protein